MMMMMMMVMMMFYLSDDGRRLAAGEFLQFRNFQSDIDERLQRDLRVDALLRLVGFVLLDVHSHRGARGTGTRQTEDESRTVREDESNALFRGDGTVNRVGVYKVVRVFQLVRAVLVPFFRFARFFAQGFNHLVARIGFAPFVIVSGEEVSAVRLPMRLGDFLDADEFPTFRDVLVSLGQNGQPRQDGPRSIFLSNAAAVGMDLATPFKPDLKYGMHSCALAAIIATESDGVTKKLFPKIMLRSPSPSEAAPKSGAFSENMTFTSSFAYVKFGSG